MALLSHVLAVTAKTSSCCLDDFSCVFSGLLVFGQALIRKTELHEGAFSTDFSSDFDTTMLEAELVDGSVVGFHDEVKKCLDFWKSKLLP